MEIGLLGGTGPAGRGLALRLASVGHEVVIGSRSALRSAELIDEMLEIHPDRDLSIAGMTNAQAALADTVILAMPWDVCAPTAAELSPRLRGKLVICMANALARVGSEFHALYPPRGSIAADVQASIPDSRVAAAFHHVPARELGELDTPMEGDVLVCADRQVAIDETMEIVQRMKNLRPLDCGSLSNAAPIEAFTAVLLQLNRKYKTRAAVRTTGLADESADTASTPPE
ncbi:MAG: NADPH-dependent F420 reductase [Acidimicrobiales bacterium]